MRTNDRCSNGANSGPVNTGGLGTYLEAILLAALALLVVACDGGRTGEDVGSQTADGLIAYFGMVPAQIVGTHDSEHPEAQMHGGVPSGPRAQHVMVSLFERDSLTRVEDADVTATVTVSDRRGRGVMKPLEPFLVDGALSYGNYFDFELHRPHRIDVTVRTRGRQDPVEFRFDMEL